MKKHFAHLVVFGMLALGIFSCKKAYDDTSLSPLKDSVTDIPVTVPNQEFFERFPIVTASLSKLDPTGAKGPFTIVLQIPADKGKIKEITKITTGTSGLANLQPNFDNLAFNYDVAAGPAGRVVPIAGNGTNQITFTSTLDKYTTYRTRVGAAAAGQAATTTGFSAQNPNQLPFYFLLTLEDGRQLISTAVRVRVLD